MKNNRKRFCAAVIGILMTAQNSALAVSATETDNAAEPTPVEPTIVETVSEYGLKTLKYYDEAGQEIIPDYATSKSYSTVTIPYYNAAEEGRVTKVKSQGSYGVCWSFAGLSCAETSLIDKGAEDNNVDFSERHLNWFTNGADVSDTTDPLYGGCANLGTAAYDTGGNHFDVISTLSRRSGPVYESVAPYSNTSPLSEELRYQSEGYLTEAEWYDVSQRDIIKKAILEHGSLYCSFNIDDDNYYNSSTYGYYSPVTMTKYGHAVTVVGWDDNYSRENFNNDPGEDGAWIVKNSWGTWWGNDGYFYISYKDATVDALVSFDMTPVDEYKYDNVYEYDAYASGRSLYYSGNGAGLGNIFTADNSEDLTAVAFMTSQADTDYTVRIYTDVTDSPTNGTLVHSQSGVLDFAGYHTVDLTKDIPLEEGTDFSVVVILAEVGANIYLDGGSTVRGRSFFTWCDTSTSSPGSWKDAYSSYSRDVIVKALTESSESDTELAITSQPEDITVDAGSPVSFSVAASGKGLSYLWQYSKNGGVSWSNTSNRTDTYSLSSAKTTYNGYQYRCVINDANGNSITSDAATLTVASALSITSQPSSVTVNAGSSASFTVKASGSGLTYLWQVSKDGGSTWSNTSNKTATYTLSSVKAAYNGYKYRCIVKDQSGNSVTSNAATLTVASALSITSQPSSVAVDAGSSASFTVKASGSGLTYQWQVSKDGGSTWSNTSNKTATYTLSSAKAAYNGYKYRCVVKDSSGNSVTSNAATLFVASALIVTGQPSSIAVNAGSSASFTVKASGTGLTYLWQVSKDGGSTWSNTSTKTATYTLSSAKITYNGYKYRCIVKDSSGNSITSNAATLTVTASASLSITSQPVSVTANEGSSASFTVKASGSGLTYLWQVSKNSGTTWTNTSTKAASYTLASVKASYNGYMYRCIVKDQSGNSVTSNAATLTVASGVSAQVQEMFELVNAYRAENGLPAYILNESLCKSADIRAAEIAEEFSHTRPDGSSCYTVITVAYSSCGENIAQGSSSVSASVIFNLWKSSSGHNANMLSDGFTDIGIGYDAASGSWVQIFIS